MFGDVLGSILLILLGIAIGSTYLSYAPFFRVKLYNIATDKILPDKKFVLLSDYHMGRSKWCDKKLVRKIKKISPEYILISGDLLTTYPAAYHGVRNNYEWALKIGTLISELSECSKVFVVDGNHEIKLKAALSGAYMTVAERYEEIILKCGAQILHNKSERVEPNLVIAGLELDDENYDKIEKVIPPENAISEKIGNCSNDYTILLTHSPEFFCLYDKWGADLILCGHMHGGIVRLGNHGLISPDRKLFPKYVYGKYIGKNSTMIVTSGIGEHTIPVRIFNPKEIVVLKLRGKRTSNEN